MAKMFSRLLFPGFISNLQSNPLYQNCLQKDVLDGSVFLAFRDGYVDFYHGGGRLFQFDGNEMSTHHKYASVIINNPKDYIAESQLVKPPVSLIGSFQAGYTRIKENCGLYSGVEASGVSYLYETYSWAYCKEDIVVLDIEVAIPDTDSRIDLVFFNKKNKTLYFVEAKHYSNNEIRSSTGNPKVVGQLNKYQQVLTAYKSVILAAYQQYIGYCNQIAPVDLPVPADVNTQPRLLIFGFDRDQQQGGLQTIEATLKQALPGIILYSVGDTKSIQQASLAKNLRC